MERVNRWIEQSMWRKSIVVCLGSLLTASAVNIINVPLNLYSGGSMGLAQLIRSMILRYTALDFGQFDFAGLINMLIVLPLGYVVYRKIGKQVIRQTIVGFVSSTLFLTIIPIPRVPVLSDPLMACIVGGVLAGGGAGLTFRYGGCAAGGANFVGMLLSKRYPNVSVGQVATLISAAVYVGCAMMYDLNIALYSLCYCVVTLKMQDYAHHRNINCGIFLFCKTEPQVLVEYIVRELDRDTTYWAAEGGFTQEKTNVLYVVLSKYELGNLKQFIHEKGLQTFITFQSQIGIEGRYAKHL